MRSRMPRFVSDYGMLIPFFLVCAFFTYFTQSDQFPTGEAAAHQVAQTIVSDPALKRVMIATRDLPDERKFAETVKADLAKHGVEVVDVVHGEPRDARAALVKWAERRPSLDVIACTPATAEWIVFANLAADFPAARPRRHFAGQLPLAEFLERTTFSTSPIKSPSLRSWRSEWRMIRHYGRHRSFRRQPHRRLLGRARGPTSSARHSAGSTTASGMVVACLMAVLFCGAVGAERRVDHIVRDAPLS
ncbi:MAG: hypothetical protein U0744_11060 [Gemmataceae bacterium]